MATLSTAGAQSLGNPAKVVRVYASDRKADEKLTSVIREEIAKPAPSPAIEVATPVPRRERVKQREHVIMLSTGPYLPQTGTLPLRFSSSRKWPEPLRKVEPPGAEAIPVVATVMKAATMPAETPAGQTTETAAQAHVPAFTAAAEAPARIEPVPTMLTADMVLGYLGNLPPAEARVSLRFEPGMPQDATMATGVGALTP